MGDTGRRGSVVVAAGMVALGGLLGGLAGCTKALTVDLPQDFHGAVTLLCGSGQGSGQGAEVHVPTGGSASGVPCPRKETELAVTRGGARVSPESRPVWHFAENGAPVSIEFNVK